MSLGFLRSAVLRAGLELRIFDHMAKGPADAETIADAAGTDPRATRLLLQGLAALDTLIVEDGKYRLTPSAQAHLVSGRPGYVGGVRRIFAGDRLWARLGRLAEGVRAGGHIDDDLEDNPDTDEWVLQAASSLMFAGPAAKSLLGVLGEWARGRERLHVLDVGCGGGSYGFYMARAHPGAKVWANDGAAVLEEAKKEVGAPRRLGARRLSPRRRLRDRPRRAARPRHRQHGARPVLRRAGNGAAAKGSRLRSPTTGGSPSTPSSSTTRQWAAGAGSRRRTPSA